MSELRRRLGKWLQSTDRQAVHAPLLTRTEIARLLALGRNASLAAAPASDFVAGDIAGKRPGSGLDFDDNRPYEPGDDARYINWRLSARTGSPYIKLFRQEYRPCAFVVLDRRAAMRFATRGKLKVQQGAAAAVLYAAMAVRRGAPVGGLLIESQPRWLPPKQGESALRSLVQGASAAAPPVEQPHEPTLDETLQQLAARLPAACKVWLISDFADLEEASAATLVRLGREHDVRGIWISDPAEHTLPDAGIVELSANAATPGIAWDSHSDAMRTRYCALAAQQRQSQTQWFLAAGIPITHLSTMDGVVSALATDG